MSPSTSSESKRQWKYDVFLNFRGADTRKSFVSHLYAALKYAGVNAFLDDERLERGAELEPELVRAIEGSRISIVVFSKSYTESRWCLNELIEILNCRRKSSQDVVPIFYHVKTSEVRHQDGEFGRGLEALASAMEAGSGVKQIVLSKWKTALTDAADLSGWDVTSSPWNEAELLMKIVEDVLTKLGVTGLPITKYQVGLESRVKEMIDFINSKTQVGRACIVGIWGMGGLGKTTSAKAIYNEIYHKFEIRSFIEDIRQVYEKDSRGCTNLQKQLLSNVLKTKVKIHNITTGRATIEKGLSGKAALIVLDDVSKPEQLDDLCGNCEWMGPGSVLIVTTRNARILSSLKVDHVFEMHRMDDRESLELFSWHAFKEKSPRRDFNELSVKVVASCGGLPLALEVLGSYLYERTKEVWEAVLSKLERIPFDKVQEKLRLSYYDLNDLEKKMFLDICCFFIGKDKIYVSEILNECGFYPNIGLTVLEEMSLLKIEKNNKLAMHNLVRDMGREIIRQCSLDEPEKRSRLWAHEDVLDVLTEQTGTNAIEGIALSMESTSKVCFHTKAFEKMKRLRILKLNHVKIRGDYKNLSRNLRWVYWRGFPSKHIPNDFDLQNVVAINLKHSEINLLWKKTQFLRRLKFLNLSHSKNLMHTPDFSRLPNLEKLVLKDCPRLSTVHQSIGDLSNILVINLMDCASLHNLPRRVYRLKSLETLILSGCSKINKLEEDIVQMESLTTLIAKHIAVKDLPRSIVRSKSIAHISLYGHEGFAHHHFPSIIWSWISPTMNPLTHIYPLWSMSSSLVSVDVQNINWGDLVPMFSSLSILLSVWVGCCLKVRLSPELRIPDDLYDVSFIELGTTSYASEASDLYIRLLFRMGCHHMVTDTFGKTISQGLTIGVPADFSLPGDHSPYWLTYARVGNSVYFEVPQTSYCRIKGMALCILFSSTLENVAAQCLVNVLIVNYTKCIFQIYKLGTIISFNDEDQQSMLSNPGPGDTVRIFVFGHGFSVKKTAVYLLCDETMDTRI